MTTSVSGPRSFVDDDSRSVSSDAGSSIPYPPAEQDVSPLAPDGEDLLCPCQQAYEDSGNSKKTLYLMCLGLNHNDAPLFSFEMPPWSRLPKSSLRPKNTDFAVEIDRRAQVLNILPTPRPRNWSRKTTMEWLQANPVRDHSDIEFLTTEVMRLREVLERAQLMQQANGEVNTGGAGGRNWRGAVPYLRVIMCLTQDHVKCLFLTRANVRTRQEIDGRNSETRPKTVFEVIADLWNSPDFNPVAPASDCHIDFHTATICSHEQVAALSPATPQQRIEDIFTSMRSDLLRIITRWEQSGQGEGGIDNSGEEEQEEQQEEALSPDADDDDNDSEHHTAGRRRNIGSLERRPARALQTRAAFLNGRPSYLLYFWEVADNHQLLNSSLQRLNNSTGASDASCAVSTAPSTSSAGSHRRKRRHQDSLDYDESVLRPLVQSIQELAECQRQLVIDRSDDRRHERRLQQRAHESTEQGLWRERRFRRKAELSDLARKYRTMNAELDPNDERSARLSEFYINECRIIEEEMSQLEQQQEQGHQQEPYEQSSSDSD